MKLANFDEFEFNTPVSLLDYDTVIISAEHLSYRYSESTTSPFQNKRLLSDYSSHQIKEDFNIIREQLQELLRQGKNIFVIVGRNEDCFIFTGEKTYSGTGKNTTTTNMVSLFEVNSFLPIRFKATYITGDELQIVAKSPFSDFFKNAKSNMYYTAYIDVDKQTPLAKIPESEKVIASVVKCGEGNIIFLPASLAKEEYKTEQAWKNDATAYLKGIVSLNDTLRTSMDDTSIPEWAEVYRILGEETEEEKLNKAKQKLEQVIKLVEKQDATLRAIQRYKALITASGTQLEEIVKTVLMELGFATVEAERGRSDVIGNYNEIPVVIEIKGVTKSAAEKHAAQLEKWVSQYYEETETKAKGLLIVNAFCDVPLENRAEEAFPHQMLKYATAREHCLLTSTQLLCLYIDIKAHPDKTTEVLMELLSCVGRYEKYTNHADYIGGIATHTEPI